MPFIDCPRSQSTPGLSRDNPVWHGDAFGAVPDTPWLWASESRNEVELRSRVNSQPKLFKETFHREIDVRRATAAIVWEPRGADSDFETFQKTLTASWHVSIDPVFSSMIPARRK